VGVEKWLSENQISLAHGNGKSQKSINQLQKNKKVKKTPGRNKPEPEEHYTSPKLQFSP